jgi:hypothetical protein
VGILVDLATLATLLDHLQALVCLSCLVCVAAVTFKLESTVHYTKSTVHYTKSTVQYVFFLGISGLDACRFCLAGCAQFIELSRIGRNPRSAQFSADSRQFNKFRYRPLDRNLQAYNLHITISVFGWMNSLGNLHAHPPPPLLAHTEGSFQTETLCDLFHAKPETLYAASPDLPWLQNDAR